MAIVCNACGGEICPPDSCLQCATCQLYFDLQCITMKEEIYNTLSEEFKSKWNCPSCVSKLPKSDNTHTPVRPVPLKQNEATNNINMNRGGSRGRKLPHREGEEDFDELLAEIRAMRQELQDIRQQNSELGLLRAEITLLKDQLTAVSSSLTGTVSDYKGAIESRDREILSLKAYVEDLQCTMNIKAQQDLRNELEVIGIPEPENENLLHTVLLLSKKIGVDVTELDIDGTYRAGPKRTPKENAGDSPESYTGKKNLPRPLVVRLIRRAKRDEIMKAAKSRKPLTTEGFLYGPTRDFFVNERLTKENRLLFRQTKLRASEHNFRFVWVRDGSILVRKAEKAPAILIRSPGDLDKHLGLPNPTEQESQS